ncbi:hypothetical protein C1J03_03950 [Sulfitobacter sp. SK012]|uniref:SulP family inorganic anion transporter n=1 Tax=Sulfitobacter sp. SK012 TaxID=1389005 RepID=UPI000E0C02D0|nr:SulP family inorganic anion transporter [Sulfitobacter sp. SK012]AXI45260.1 hypothetical protein C1J03_03950 [Sulfitobacter sp. SK012]
MVTLLRNAFGAVFIAAVSAVFAISFAAIIYSGDLTPYLDRGIGLTLMGCVVLGVCGAFTLSYRGSILQAQDVPAILLAGAAGSLVAKNELSGEVLFASTASLTALASLSMGLAAMLFGHFKFANLARFIPYPVLAGFLAATGLLLFLGAIGVATGLSPEIKHLSALASPDALQKWVPVSIAAIGIVLATRLFPGSLTLPLALLVTALGFYAYIGVLGLSMDAARSAGFLLGPFQDGGLLGGLAPKTLQGADWGAVFAQAPVIVTIVAVSMIGTTLNATGLELSLGQDMDINRETKGVGIANALGAFVGGIPGYHLLGETILARRLGLIGPLAGISAAMGCAAVLVLGVHILEVLPVGLFASVIAFLGVDLLYTWLWEERRKLTLRDYGIVAIIPVIAITFSFLAAIAAGLIMAFGFFVIAYAKLDVIRSQSSGAVRRSFVERPDDQLAVLSKVGGQAQIIELSGYLFFGSANVLRKGVQALLLNGTQSPRWLVVDFKHVSGIDISTWHTLQRVARDCAEGDVTLVLSGINDTGRTDMDLVQRTMQCERFGTLDQALEHIEDILLSTNPSDEGEVSGLVAEMFLQGSMNAYVETIKLRAGETVIERGSASDDIFILQSGQLVVSVPQENGAPAIVALIRPGSVIGEMAYYTGRARSADIIADRTSELTRIDARRLEGLERQNPAVAAAFHKLIARHMARRLNHTTLLLRDLGF